MPMFLVDSRDIFDRDTLGDISTFQRAVVHLIELVIPIHPDDVLGKRIGIILLMIIGLSPYRFAESLGYSPKQCYNVMDGFKDGGFSGIVPKTPGKAQEPKVTQDVERFVVKEIFDTMVQGYPCPSDEELSDRLEKELGIELHERTIRGVRCAHGLIRLRSAQKKKPKSEGPSDEDTESEPRSIQIRTSYAGLWLFLPLVLSSHWYRKAVRVFSFRCSHSVTVPQLIRTLLFTSLVGIRRIFHFDDENDPGLALITGRTSLITHSAVWKLINDIPTRAFWWFYDLTSTHLIGTASDLISLDTHTVPRWTSVVSLPKTWVSTRGRAMKALGQSFLFDVRNNRFIGLRITTKKTSTLLSSVIRNLKAIIKTPFTLLSDNEAYSGPNLERLLDDSQVTVLTTASKTDAKRRQWKRLPQEIWRRYTKPLDVFKPKIDRRNLHIAKTKTEVSNCKAPLTTAVIMDPSKSEKRKFSAIISNDDRTSAKMMADLYALHWHQETAYRYCKHDLGLDTVPKTYRIRRHRDENGEIVKRTIIENPARTLFFSWFTALTFNLTQDFADLLGKALSPGTIIRRYVKKSGTITLKDDVLEVSFDHFRRQDDLKGVVSQLNRNKLKLPWLGDAVLKIRLADDGRKRSTPFHIVNEIEPQSVATA